MNEVDSINLENHLTRNSASLNKIYKSMEEKVIEMNTISGMIFNKVNDYDEQLRFLAFDDEDIEQFWCVADGHAENHVMKRIEGRCSLSEMMKPITELEDYVDNKLSIIKRFEDAIIKIESNDYYGVENV